MLKFKMNCRKTSIGLHQPNAGFTVIEMVVVVVLVAILAIIATPSFLAFLTRQRLFTAQTEAITAIKEAQAKAKQKRAVYTACFRDKDERVKWTVVPGTDCSTAGGWNNINESDSNIIAIDPDTSSNSGDFYTFSFREKGWVETNNPNKDNGSLDLGTITFMTRNQPKGSKRCVYAATLLGSLRTDSDDKCKKPG